MKALSLTPPWHVAILRHGKRVENRDWRGCSYRGPILLHASKGIGTLADFDETVEGILDIVSPPPGMGPGQYHAVAHEMAEVRIGGRGWHHAEGWWAPAPHLARGAIVGRCNVVDVIDPGSVYPSRCYPSNPNESAKSPWYMGGFALILADVEAIDAPIPFKGALGFFEVPEGLLSGATWTKATTEVQRG